MSPDLPGLARASSNGDLVDQVLQQPQEPGQGPTDHGARSLVANTLYRQLLDALRAPPSQEQQAQVSRILRNNPQLIAQFIRHKRNSHPERIAELTQHTRNNSSATRRGRASEDAVGQSPAPGPVRRRSRPAQPEQPARVAATAIPGYQQLLDALRAPPSQEQQSQVSNILRSNPHLMAAFIRNTRNMANAAAGR